MKTAAIVPMRHDSKRVPGKNYRDFAGTGPLWRRIIDTLLNVDLIDEVWVDTDSIPMMQDLQRDYDEDVGIVVRPPNLRADTTPMNEVLAHTVCKIQADHYLQTHATNPLLRAETIGSAILMYQGRREIGNDSLFGVTRWQSRFYDHLGHPINHDPAKLLRTQDLPPLFEDNSCLYLFEHREFLDRENRIGENPCLYEIDRLEAVDIDDEQDWLIAEALHASLNRQAAEAAVD